jgi:hypothetical protein
MSNSRTIQTLPGLTSSVSTRTLIAGVAIALSVCSPAWAQDSAADTVAHAVADTAASRLAGIEGDWQGSGWTLDRAGERQTFDVYEQALFAADGHVIIVLGEGFAPAGAGRDGRKVHDAAGFITRVGEGFQMRAVTGEGRMQDVPLEFNDEGFEWTLDLGPHGRMVYSTTLVGDVWTENGSYCPLEGECRQTFHMRIERQ